MKHFYLKCLAVLALVITMSFTANAQCTGLTAPFTESFDGTTAPTCWTPSATTGDGWRFTGTTNSVNCSAASDNTGNGGNYAWVDQSSTDAGTILESDDIDVTALTTPYVEFYYWMCGVGYTPINELYVEAYDGTVWNLVGSINTATAGWEAFGYDLSSHVYNTNFVKIRFRAESGGSADDYYGDHAIDDVSVMEAPTCFRPTAVMASNLSSTSADLGWTDNNAATSWEIEYGTPGFAPGSGTAIVVNSNPYTLSSLTANTPYAFTVRAICGPADSSSWSSPVSFRTSCVSYTAPYAQNFDGTTAPDVDPCWTVINNTSGRCATDATPIGTTPFSGTNTLEMYNGNGTTPTDMLLITPQFTDLDNTKRIRFQVYDYSNTSDLIIGTMSDPNDAMTFTPYDTITEAEMADDVWEAHSVNFDTYVGTDQYIAFAHGMNTTFDYINLDDFSYELIPTCPEPTGLNVTNATGATLDFGWTAGGGETEWQVEYGADGFALGTGTNAVTTSNPHPVSGLTGNADYDFYVRGICAPGDTSPWSGPFSFLTPCTAFVPPYLEDFSGGIPPTACWSEAAEGAPWNGGPAGSVFGNWGPDGFANQGTTGAAKINLYTTGKQEWLLSPDYDLTTGGPFQLQYDFAIYNFGSPSAVGSLGSDDTIQVLISTDLGVTWSSLMVHDAAYTAVAGGTNEVIDLTAYSGSTVRFAIWGSEGTVDDPEDVDVFVDNFWVRAIPSCLDPSGLMASNVTSSSAEIGWTAGNAGSTAEVEYGPAGFTPGMGTTLTTMADSINLTTLTPNTVYEVYMREDCGGGANSVWIGPIVVATPCLPFAVFPYTQDFDLLTANDGSIFNCVTTDNSGDCWSNGVGQSNNWTARSVATGSSNTGPSADHTGSGNYVYLEGSGCSGNTSDLYSATFDFTALAAPTLSFWYHMYGGDMGTLEVSYTTDGGTTWSAPIWSLSGDQGNMWQEAKMLLPILAGESAVVFRFSGTTGPSFATDMAIDDVTVDEAPADDVAVTSLSTGTCSNAESVTVELSNFGANIQTSIPVSLSINGAAPMMETWTGTLAPGASAQYTFTATFDASTPGTYNLNVMAQLPGDLEANNDSRLETVNVTPILAAPHGETFEGSTVLPQGWSVSVGGIGNGHGSGSNVLFRNMWASAAQDFVTTTPKFAVSAGDMMEFDYRYVDYSNGTGSNPTTLGADSINVQISTDCGVTFTTVAVINASNHVTSTSFARKSYDLTAYAGQTIVGRLQAVYVAGDYFLDLDNFFVGAPMAQSSTATAELCAGGNNGTGTITATNGIAPYTYDWSNGETTMMAMNLPAGMNYYTVTDAAGTMITDSVSVTAGPMVSAAIAMDAMVSCNGMMDASVSASMMNGTAPYTYSWTNGATTDSLLNIGAGTYAVVITDANGCNILESVTVTEPMAMSVMTSAMNVSCNGAADGTVTTAVMGGTTGYTYMWSNMATTDSLTGLAGGTYDVTITDANGCMTTGSATVVDPAAITVTPTTDANVDCNGDNDGAVSVAATGGTGMLTYMWSNGSTMASATNLSGGTYDVTVTDANGCMMNSSATVTEAAALVVAMSSVADSLHLGNGSATAAVTGGTAPYTYAWSNGGTTETLTNLVEGLLTVVITDANGCTISGFVDVADIVGTNGIDYVSNLSIYPNPTNSNTVIDLELSQNAEIAVSIYTVTGVLVQDFGKETTSKATHTVDVTDYAAGMYLVRFVIDNQVVTKKLLVTK